jgi:hypothetical protein
LRGEPSNRRGTAQKKLTEGEASRPPVEPVGQAQDDLRRASIAALFKPDKTFRDDIHHDVMLTKLKVHLVNTPSLQRLRKIKQLGATSLVYPSAVHTRFEHSLGTLATAVRLTTVIEKNPSPDWDLKVIISDYDRLIIRLCAVLHDLAHIPFGRSLEDEGHLFPSQWTYPGRVEFLLGPSSDFSKVLRANAQLAEAAKHNSTFRAPEAGEEVTAL